jgi:hypothetical protein
MLFVAFAYDVDHITTVVARVRHTVVDKQLMPGHTANRQVATEIGRNLSGNAARAPAFDIVGVIDSDKDHVQ